MRTAARCRDIREVVPQVRARYPTAPLFAIGWSLGANILVNYLGEEGAAAAAAAAAGKTLPPVLDGAASMCNPFDLVTCDAALEHGMVRCRLMAPRRRACSLAVR